MSDFPYNPKDARFIGSPIDFIIFDGLSDGDVRKVVFVEVKTGNSGLSSRQKQIRDAIRSRNVEWKTVTRPEFKMSTSPTTFVAEQAEIPESESNED